MISSSENIAGMQMDVASNSLDRVLPELNYMERLSTCNQILDGVTYVHSKDVCNYDIKPENILWLDGRPVLSDFGCSAIYKPSEMPILNDSQAISDVFYASLEFLGLQINKPRKDKKGGVNLYKSVSWNLGLSIAEIMTGLRLFPVKDLISPKIGLPVPPDLINYQELTDGFFEEYKCKIPEHLEVLI